MNITANDNLLSYSLNYIKLDELSINDAKSKFLTYQSKGIIKDNCTFESDVWYTTDEYSNVGLHFNFNIFSYHQYEDIFQMNLNSFVEHLKAFVVSIIGKNALLSIQVFLEDISKIINTNISDIYGITNAITLHRPVICSDFISMLPNTDSNEDVENLINALDSYSDILFSKHTGKMQRSLASMDTYLLFDEIITDYWSSNLPTEERLFYFPLYFWWVLTGVIALRPREFLLTQRDCLSYENGSYYLKLRRNQLKGTRDHISYKIDEDYTVETYKIPDHIGNEIKKYLELTKDYENTDIDTLFVTDTHYKKWGQSKHSNSRFLTYMNMNTILRYFYKEIIQERYHLNVVYDKNTDEHLKNDEIGYIHLGDTRHIALINLMHEGGTPVIAMLLSGHTNMEMAGHYYSNLTKFIECKTYRQYRRLTDNTPNFKISVSKPLPNTKVGKPIANKGFCYSESCANGNFEDCLSAVGDNGEIGNCENCNYYRKTNESFFMNDDIYKEHIKQDCNALLTAVETVRAEKGSTDSIGEALLKLKASSTSYEQYLIEKQMQKGDNN